MFLILWEFEVKPGCEQRFERVYGPDGDWVRFFRRDPAYRGTRLMRDTSWPHTYMALDFWTCRNAYDSFRQRNQTEYESIDARCEALTQAETPLGTYNLAAQDSGAGTGRDAA